MDRVASCMGPRIRQPFSSQPSPAGVTSPASPHLASMLHPHPALLPTPSPVLQVDPVFEGLSGGAGSLIKYNPLSNITSAECWNFLRVMVSMSPAGMRHRAALHFGHMPAAAQSSAPARPHGFVGWLASPTPRTPLQLPPPFCSCCAGRARERPARLRLHQHRLRAMHPPRAAQPGGARGALVVGGRRGGELPLAPGC